MKTTLLFMLNWILSSADFINPKVFFDLVLKLTLNTGIVLVLVRCLYYPSTRRKDYLFTYILIATIIFLLCYLLANVQLQMGFSLGLFAIFGIIRYRTNSMPIKEMTYLFVVIGLSVVNALSSDKIRYAELLFTNGVILGLVYCLEKVFLLKHESCKAITYENIQLIKPDKQAELFQDLEDRTGLKINRIEVGRIDFMHDTARLSIYYYSDKNQVNQTDEMEAVKGGDDD